MASKPTVVLSKSDIGSADAGAKIKKMVQDAGPLSVTRGAGGISTTMRSADDVLKLNRACKLEQAGGCVIKDLDLDFGC